MNDLLDKKFWAIGKKYVSHETWWKNDFTYLPRR